MAFLVKKIWFFSLLVMGVILVVCSDTWFGAWVGLELNLMSFIPFMSVKSDIYSSESSLKYFLVQAFGSAVVVLGVVIFILLSDLDLIIVSALLLKMGAAPLHFWFPHIMSGLSWLSCMVLMSLQKIAPMVLLSFLVNFTHSNSSSVIIWSAVLSAIVGGVGGLNQVFLRKILAYSSINHMSWLLVSLTVSDMLWGIYFVFYVVISGTVVYLFSSQQMFHVSNMVVLKWSFLSVVLFMSLLSLGGLPPFTGFVPKWFLLQELLNSAMFLPLLFLLSGTLISLYYYLRLVLFSMSVSFWGTKWGKNLFFVSNKMVVIMFISLAGLLFPSLLF